MLTQRIMNIHYSSKRRYRHQISGALCGVITYFMLYIGLLSNTEYGLFNVIEDLEHWIKHSVFHQLQNEYLQQFIDFPPINNTKIFFLHIPRTAGDSIRTNLFGVNKSWILDDSEWSPHKMPFDIQRQKSQNQSVDAVYASWRQPHVQVVKGNFGFDDIASFPFHGTKRIFTVF